MATYTQLEDQEVIVIDPAANWTITLLLGPADNARCTIVTYTLDTSPVIIEGGGGIIGDEYLINPPSVTATLYPPFRSVEFVYVGTLAQWRILRFDKVLENYPTVPT